MRTGSHFVQHPLQLEMKWSSEQQQPVDDNALVLNSYRHRLTCIELKLE